MSDKPEMIANDDFIDNLYEEIANDPAPRDTVSFFHLADIHI